MNCQVPVSSSMRYNPYCWSCVYFYRLPRVLMSAWRSPCTSITNMCDREKNKLVTAVAVHGLWSLFSLCFGMLERPQKAHSCRRTYRKISERRRTEAFWGTHCATRPAQSLWMTSSFILLFPEISNMIAVMVSIPTKSHSIYLLHTSIFAV